MKYPGIKHLGSENTIEPLVINWRKTVKVMGRVTGKVSPSKEGLEEEKINEMGNKGEAGQKVKYIVREFGGGQY